jgi:ABC-2 type transport system ATP-binding protein
MEDIKTLREDNYKKITLRGAVDSGLFQMDGITELTEIEDEMKFFYKGDINIMTKKISELSLKDALIEEPTLEEIFMHYYK